MFIIKSINQQALFAILFFQKQEKEYNILVKIFHYHYRNGALYYDYKS
jgi:hypothetical protein